MEEELEDLNGGGEEVYLVEDEVEETYEEMEEILCSDMEDLDIDSDGESDDNPASINPLRDDAKLCFSEHKGSVFSVSVDKSGAFACSGGEDDVGLVWKISDGSVVLNCQGHKDSVTCTGFSWDGKYVATADMGGLIQVWACPTGNLVQSFQIGDIEWLKWHPHAHVLLVGGSDGSGWMWRIPSGDCKTFQGESSCNSCAAMTSDGKRICCGYSNGAVKVLDLKSGVPLVSLTGSHGHAKAVTCLDVHKENILLLTGSEDETAKLINSNSGKVLSVFPAGFPPDSRGDNVYTVEGACFSPIMPLAITGSLSGVLGVWDLSTQKLRLKCIQQSYDQLYRPGVVSLCCSQITPVAYTGSLDGVVRGWDLRNGELVREWHGHSSHILHLTLLNESAILSASDDKTVRIFSLAA